jgi:hypothetical protein
MVERLWGLVTGLLVGAGVFGHALRLVILGTDEFVGRHAVAGFAVLLYGVASAFAFFRHRAGLWIAVLGPVGGITAVTLSPNAHVDAFQIVLGVPQIMALALALYLLRKPATLTTAARS